MIENIYSLITMLSIKEGLKPVGRLDCFSKKELDSYTKEIGDLSLFYKTIGKSDEVKSEEIKTHIYFSKNKKGQRDINRLVELHKQENCNDEIFARNNIEMGKIYGYPDCCINWFIGFLTDWFAKNKNNEATFPEPNQSSIILEILANSKGNQFDKTVNSCQGDSPIPHLPHSFNCKKSIMIGKENLKILEKYDRELSLKYQEYIKGTFRIYQDKIERLESFNQKGKNIIYFK